jgi:hypothetical protein
VRPGQGDRELDLAQGGRGALPRAGPRRAPLRRRRRGDGLRRGGPGRHRRAQGRDLPPLLRPAHAGRGLRPLGHDLRPQHLRGGDRHPRARRLRGRLHRGDPPHPRRAAARPCLGRRLQHLLLVPRQRPGARGDALGLPLPRDPGRHGHGDRQPGPSPSTTTSPRSCASASRTCCSTAAGRDRAPRRDRRPLPRLGRGAGEVRPRVARGAGRRAPAPRPGARHHRLRDRGHRGGAPRRPRSRCTSSRAR